MSNPRRHWLFKSEPDAYSIDDLARDGVGGWDGVRNHQARNLLRDQVRVDDLVLFYHSRANPPGVVGIARVASPPYPDASAQDPSSPYYDFKASPDNPIWMMVDVVFVEKFPNMVTLDRLKNTPELADMMVTQKGRRLSIQPVSAGHFRIVKNLAKSAQD